MSVKPEALLKVYEHETEPEIGPGERLFRLVAFLSFALFGAAGLYLKTHNPPPHVLEERMARSRQVSFIIEEKKNTELTAVKPKPPAPKKTEPPKPQEPVDLASKPRLDQKVEDTKPEPPPEPEEKEARRVYGLRKVYATGIGAGGDAADAVIGKQGNTLNTDIDTFTASRDELKGKVAPVTTVSALPRLKTAFKPEYTREMIDNEVEGVVRVKLLIGEDGRVKEAVVLNDLGFGSRQKVYEACLRLLFEPAMRNGQPVAVWHIFSFRFELTE